MTTNVLKMCVCVCATFWLYLTVISRSTVTKNQIHSLRNLVEKVHLAHLYGEETTSQKQGRI